MMVRTGSRPSELVQALFAKVGPHFYDRIDTPLPADRRAELQQRVRQSQVQELAGLPVRKLDQTDGYKFDLGEEGWLLIRFSGTEPIVRVYCETTEQARVEPLLHAGLDILGLRT